MGVGVKRVSAVAGTLVAMMMLALMATASPSEEQAFVDAINVERASRGLGELVVVEDLVAGARLQAGRNAEVGGLSHNQDLGSITDGWNMLGENVGMGGDVVSLHAAFMSSAGHRDNLLKPNYDAVGVGVVHADGVMYVAEVFMDAIVDPVVTSGTGADDSFNPPFKDDDGSVHEGDIARLLDLGVTSGCGPDLYCPNRSVTRGEMASMFSRAFGVPTSPTDTFGDDDSSVHERAINGLALAGITKGCDTGRFCPDRPVSRGELATFFVRILDLPTTEQSQFDDIGSSVHANAINALALAGVAKGCDTDSYCPDQPVSRAQMASFIVRILDRT